MLHSFGVIDFLHQICKIHKNEKHNIHHNILYSLLTSGNVEVFMPLVPVHRDQWCAKNCSHVNNYKMFWKDGNFGLRKANITMTY